MCLYFLISSYIIFICFMIFLFFALWFPISSWCLPRSLPGASRPCGLFEAACASTRASRWNPLKWSWPSAHPILCWTQPFQLVEEIYQLKTVVLSHYHIRIWWSQVCANDFSMEKNTFHISSMEPKFMLNTTLSMVPIVSQLCGLSYSTSTMVAWVLNIWGKGLFGVWYDVSVVPTCWLWLLCDITT